MRARHAQRGKNDHRPKPRPGLTPHRSEPGRTTEAARGVTTAAKQHNRHAARPKTGAHVVQQSSGRQGAPPTQQEAQGDGPKAMRHPPEGRVPHVARPRHRRPRPPPWEPRQHGTNDNGERMQAKHGAPKERHARRAPTPGERRPRERPARTRRNGQAKGRPTKSRRIGQAERPTQPRRIGKAGERRSHQNKP